MFCHAYILFESGGIKITVTGENLNSVMAPELYVYQEIKNISKDGHVIFSVQKYESVSLRFLFINAQFAHLINTKDSLDIP